MKTRKLALVLAALAAPLLAAGSAMADTVTYRTYGTFTGSAGDTVVNATGFNSLVGPTSTLAAPGGLTLSFAGVGTTAGFSVPTYPGASFQLGVFNLTGLAGAFAGTEKFTIFINQTAPASTPSSQSSVGSISGSVTSTGAQSVVFSFNPTVLTFGNEQYTLPSFVGVDSSVPAGNSLTATVIGPSASPSTPLPKAAMAGVGLLGLLGLTKVRKAKLA